MKEDFFHEFVDIMREIADGVADETDEIAIRDRTIRELGEQIEGYKVSLGNADAQAVHYEKRIDELCKSLTDLSKANMELQSENERLTLAVREGDIEIMRLKSRLYDALISRLEDDKR